MEFQAVKYPNLNAFNGQNLAIIAHAKTRGAIIVDWGYIQGVDGTVLCCYDERLSGFPFNPNAVQIFSTEDLNYFPISEL